MYTGAAVVREAALFMHESLSLASLAHVHISITGKRISLHHKHEMKPPNRIILALLLMSFS